MNKLARFTIALALLSSAALAQSIAPQTISGDGTLASTGSLSVAKSGGVAFGTAAFTASAAYDAAGAAAAVTTTSIGAVPTSRTVNGLALSSNITITTISGNAATATALASNGSNCTAGNYAQGVDASGNAEGCGVPAGTYSLPTATSSVLGGVKPDGTTITNSSGAISVTYGTGSNTAAQGNDSRITGAVQSGGALGTPSSGTLTNCTFPTLNQNTSGTAAGLSGSPDVSVGNVSAAKAATYNHNIFTGNGGAGLHGGWFDFNYGAITKAYLTWDINVGAFAAGAVGFGTSGSIPLDLGTNDVRRVRIDTDGRTLVNTTTNNGKDQLQVNGTVSVNLGTNVVYYCNGGVNAGVLGRGNSGPCVGGSWVATSLKVD